MGVGANMLKCVYNHYKGRKEVKDITGTHGSDFSHKCATFPDPICSNLPKLPNLAKPNLPFRNLTSAAGPFNKLLLLWKRCEFVVFCFSGRSGVGVPTNEELRRCLAVPEIKILRAELAAPGL